MTEKNLYFYIIRIGKEHSTLSMMGEKKESSYDGREFFIFQIHNGSKWIISCVEEGLGSIVDTINRINAYLESEEVHGFSNIYFGIHGADWFIDSRDYNSNEKFFPEEFGHLKDKYAHEIVKTNKFRKEIKGKYELKNCVIKVFSHETKSRICRTFREDLSSFLSDEGQKKIFICTTPLLAAILHSFRVIITSLDIADSDPKQHPKKDILNDLKMLLKEIFEGRMEDSAEGAQGFIDYLPDRNHLPDYFKKAQAYLRNEDKDLREFITNCKRIEIEMTNILRSW